MTARSLVVGELPLSDIKLFEQLFDRAYYLSQIAPARVKGGQIEGQTPEAHFLAAGWREGLHPTRWFDTTGYLAAYAEARAAGINPFVYYLEIGRAEGHAPMPYFQDHSWRHPDLKRQGRCEYGPVRHILQFDPPQGISEPLAFSGRLCVHVHLFYPEMTDQMIALLARLPQAFTLFVSVPDDLNPKPVEAVFTAALPLAAEVLVRTGPNRGRDVAPWLVLFREEIRNSDLFLHLHSKKSPHGSYHEGWFEYLSHSLLGSKAIAAQVLGLFARDRDLGLVAPAYWPQLRRAPNYGDTQELCQHLGLRLKQEVPVHCPDFPAGSFFFCRTALIAPLLDLDLTYSDFPHESGQICGTLAHAMERMVGVVAAQSDWRFDMVAVDLPYDQAPQQPRKLPALAQETENRMDLPSVSVICPVTGWDGQVPVALASALAQDLPPLEILLVDGSGDDWAVTEICQRYAAELETGQMRLMAASRPGLAAACNLALEEARGDIIVYLDETAVWQAGYLAQVCAGFAAEPTTTCLYSNLVDHNGAAGPAALRQPRYDRAQALQHSDIVLASFAHRRQLCDGSLARLRFDPALEEGAAWDFILQATARQAPVHLDVLEVAAALPAVSAQTRRRVQVKHRNERLYWQQDQLQIALKIPAPDPMLQHRWGDLHLAESLARALERLGCRTRLDILPNWYSAASPEDDATLVLRGVHPYEPRPEHINLMWHISHPNRVSWQEMEAYDHVFVSAYAYGLEVEDRLRMRASVLLQCSDPTRFHPEVDLSGVPQHDLLFIGNSRMVRRWMPEACVQYGLPIAVYGAEWEGLIDPKYIHGTYVPNDRLAAYYGAAKIVLNDHWPDMAAKGFVSNRVMDVGLSGALLISDSFEGSEIFQGHVVTCQTPQEVKEAVEYYLHNPEARQEKAAGLRQLVLREHTVEVRARQILKTLKGLMQDRARQLRA